MGTYYGSNDKHQKNERKQVYKQLKFPTKPTALIPTGSNFPITLNSSSTEFVDRATIKLDCVPTAITQQMHQGFKKGNCLSRHKFCKAAFLQQFAQFRAHCFKHQGRKKENFNNNRWSCKRFSGHKIDEVKPFKPECLLQSSRN